MPILTANNNKVEEVVTRQVSMLSQGFAHAIGSCQPKPQPWNILLRGIAASSFVQSYVVMKLGDINDYFWYSLIKLLLPSCSVNIKVF